MIQDLDVARKLSQIYQSAEKRGIECSISLKKVKQLLNRKRCFYTRKKFELKGEFAKTFDRVDNDLGYTDGNVVACTHRINVLKNNVSLKEITLLHQSLEEWKTKK